MAKNNSFRRFLRSLLYGEQPTGTNGRFMTCQEFFSQAIPTCDGFSVRKTGSVIHYEKTTKCHWNTTEYGTGSDT